MKFLVDVNASGSVATWLAEHGHNVALVGAKNPRMSDKEILSWALEEQRIIITTDKDFEEMIWHQGLKHCGLVRLENVPRHERIALLDEALQNYSDKLKSGAIVIASTRKFRVRHP